MRLVQLVSAAALLLLSFNPSGQGEHAGCNIQVRDATEVGPFYIVDTARFIYEETNGVAGLQLSDYGCYHHTERWPGDTCYFDREQMTSTVCPIQVGNRWLP